MILFHLIVLDKTMKHAKAKILFSENRSFIVWENQIKALIFSKTAPRILKQTLCLKKMYKSC